MKEKLQTEIKILKIFNFPNGMKMTLIDCEKEPMVGDCLVDKDGDMIWKIRGVVARIKFNPKIKPVYHLGKKNHLRSVSLKAIKEKTELAKGDIYYLIRPPLLI